MIDLKNISHPSGRKLTLPTASGPPRDPRHPRGRPAHPIIALLLPIRRVSEVMDGMSVFVGPWNSIMLLFMLGRQTAAAAEDKDLLILPPPLLLVHSRSSLNGAVGTRRQRLLSKPLILNHVEREPC